MSGPKFPEFRPLTLEDRAVLQPYFDRYPCEGSEFSFGANFIWRHYDRPQWTTIDGNLCLHFQPPGEPAYFLPPIGERNLPAAVETCLTYAPRLSRVPAAFARAYCPGFCCAADRNDFDYVYRAIDLAELRGKQYDGKRNRIRKFERAHAWRYVPLEPGHLEACHRLFEAWLAEKEKDGSYSDMVAAQKGAIGEALAHFTELRMVGGAIEVGGSIVAISIGERQTPDMAVVHFEIVQPGFDGLAQLLNREYVRRAWPDCQYINRESDLGVPGLRRAKMSYGPHHLVEKFHLWR